MKNRFQSIPFKIIFATIVFIFCVSATGFSASETPPIPCRIAFETDRDGNREIYVMEPDGSNPVNRTNNPADDMQPSWSPDGTRIAFVSNRETDGEGGQFVYVMDSEGENVRQLNTENESTWPDWSPDGRMITYTAFGDIYAINADGSGEAVNLTNSPEEDQRSNWSPDSQKILWLSGNNGRYDIFTMNADGSKKKQLTKNAAVNDAVWSIDGRIFGHWDSKENGCFNCIMNADGTNITNAGGKGDIANYVPFVTADGQRIELIAGDYSNGNNEILLVSPTFPEVFRNISQNKANDINPDWPVMCLSGLQREMPDKSTDPATKPGDLTKKMTFGYAGDRGMQKERARDMQIACDELGIECVYGEMPELVNKGVDAIIQNTDKNSVNGLQDDIVNATEKGIPVFLLDAETKIDGSYSVTVDYNLWAKTSFEWMLEKIGGKGEIAYFDLDPVYRFPETIKDLLSHYPDITVVEFRDGDYPSEKVKPETSDFVNMYPDLKAIWTSYFNFQAMDGLKFNGIPYEKWPVMVCEANRDGLLTWQKVQAEYPKFDCFASVNPPGIAYAAIYAAYYLKSGYQLDETVLGGEFGRTLYVDIPVVTNENFREELDEMVKNDTHVVDELMTPEEIKAKWFIEK